MTLPTRRRRPARGGLTAALAGLLLAGCASAAPTGDEQSSPPPTPTQAQLQVYVDVLPVSLHFLIADSLPEGAVIDPGEFASPQTWEELLAQGQQLCTDAREAGWEAARAALADRVRSTSTERTWDPALDQHLGLLVRAQESAVTADGSLCPELRPA